MFTERCNQKMSLIQVIYLICFYFFYMTCLPKFLVDLLNIFAEECNEKLCIILGLSYQDDSYVRFGPIKLYYETSV